MMNISAKELPADEPLEALEPVAYFNGTNADRCNTSIQIDDSNSKICDGSMREDFNRCGHFQTMYRP
jgi:hypothetical protein